MIYTTQLQKLGFSTDEAIIYEILLDKGPSSIVKISALSLINRPSLYKTLPKMIKKEYIHEIKVGKRVEYVASSPNKLEPLIKSTQQVLERIVDNLTESYARKQVVPTIELYYGKEGIGRIYMDIVSTLNKGETYYRYGMRNEDQDDYAPPSYRKIRDQKKLERLAIMGKDRASIKTPKLERHIKVIAGDIYESLNVTKFIYQHKVAIIDYDNKIKKLMGETLGTLKVLYNFLKCLEQSEKIVAQKYLK